LASYCGDLRVFTCPEFAGNRTMPYAAYGINGWVDEFFSRFRQVPDPTRTPMVFDSLARLGYWYSDLDYRHLGVANGLYGDGHVEACEIFPLQGYIETVPLPGRPSGQSFTFVLRMAGTPWRR